MDPIKKTMTAKLQPGDGEWPVDGNTKVAYAKGIMGEEPVNPEWPSEWGEKPDGWPKTRAWD